ncbi:MAG: hypothetical protein IKN14_08630 [Clostridiales bacterium]|nr:hypothetical protein [Clostridiales bacterium]
MTSITGRIENLIGMTMDTCRPWITSEDGSVLFKDPVDGCEISAHYGASHMAASLIILGKLKDDHSMISEGESLLGSLLDRWDYMKSLPGFHNDFNNFALCIIDGLSDRSHDRIKDTVLKTDDTSFNTVNWLPMRWYVNRKRLEWTGEERYGKICEDIRSMLDEAVFPDGFIDDMLPKGRSFSLQYDVASTAFMQFLRVSGEQIDISSQTGALLNALCPDGDINYMGRGTNQVFCWGLWIYLLSSAGLNDELDRALSYLEGYLPVMLMNNNIMLNSNAGKEKYMWWDYHYCSVYTAHLLMWLVLALCDYGKKPVVPSYIPEGNSGLHIYRNDDSFVALFDGRSEYLAEKGPVISAVWTKESGTVFKGSFGPWYGLFGNRYIRPDASRKNFMGMMRENDGIIAAASSLIRKISRPGRKDTSGGFDPVFYRPQIDITDGIKITYRTDRHPAVLNIPVFKGSVLITVDGSEVKAQDTVTIRNQYGQATVTEMLIAPRKTVEIRIT